MVTVSIDAMGGDHGVGVTVSASIHALNKFSELRIILVGDSHRIQAELASLHTVTSDRLDIQHASQVVAMDDPPAQALRNKKDSSMRVAINLVQEGAADAAISAGNTGALMAMGRFVLKMLPGIDRPAIITAIPALNGHTNVLDLGANVDCKAEHLFQFAVMGSVLVSAVDDRANPTVGLLNVGQEAIKGNEQVKEANRLLEASPLNYIGYVEGDDIYCGDVDIVVCDGFVGNVSLKASEGVAKMVLQFARQEFGRTMLTKVGGLIAMPVLKSFTKRIDPRRYNGATLLGLRGVVIKSHGGADPLAFGNAIKIAYIEANKGVPQRITEQLASRLNPEHPN